MLAFNWCETELTDMQSEAEQLMIDEGTIERVERDADGTINGYVVYGVTFCRVTTQNKVVEDPNEDRTRVVTAWEIHVPMDTDIEDTDKITVNGVTYEVVGSSNYPSTDLVIKTLQVLKVE